MISERLELADWRRQISELYASIRANPDPQGAWAQWKAERDRLYRTHPQSPIPAAERGDATAPEYYPYDPALRTVAEFEAADGATFELPDSAAGHVGAERAGIARFELGGEPLSVSRSSGSSTIREASISRSGTRRAAMRPMGQAATSSTAPRERTLAWMEGE